MDTTDDSKAEQVELLPCPFCGSQPKIRPDSQIIRVNCKNRNCAIFAVAIQPRFWNVRVNDPNTRQRAERAAARIVKEAVKIVSATTTVFDGSIVADIIAAEFNNNQ